MLHTKLCVYVARSMTGRIKQVVVEEAKREKEFLEACGIRVLDPVAEEKVEATKDVLNSTYDQMVDFWKRDKEMIREAHALFDMTPHMKSEGVAHEIGYARYHLWKKVIRVYPDGMLPQSGSIAYFEDDYITDSLLDAVMELYRTHGTLFKRLIWRFNIYQKSFFRSLVHRLGEWK